MKMEKWMDAAMVVMKGKTNTTPSEKSENQTSKQ
jgi:hypothetical protein